MVWVWGLVWGGGWVDEWMMGRSRGVYWWREGSGVRGK